MQFLFDFLGSNDFMPHGMCLLWNPTLLSMHVLSDFLIAFSYYSIAITLVHYMRRRKDFPFPWHAFIFGMFLVACGTTHLFSIITIWIPLYWLDGLLKIFTATVSILAALMILRGIPLALNLRSTGEFETELAYQGVEKGKRAAELDIANKELAYQSIEKTNRAAELLIANVELAHQADDKAKRAEELQDFKEEAKLVRELAFYDALTSLPNRRLLDDRLMQAMLASKRSGCYSALLFLDLDNFKPLNDKYGHTVGDSLLIEAANRLKSCVREIDTVARFGGDEFVVLLSVLNTDNAESKSQALFISEKIHKSLSEPYLLNRSSERNPDSTIEYYCTASIGVVLFNNDEVSLSNILKHADSAMYAAKASGRNSVRFYE